MRDVGFRTRFGPEDIKGIPTRRASMFDFIRAAPGISPTSPSSATTTTVSAFGSGTNENQFLIDGTNTTCPCNGVARSELGIDFIQEVQVQSAGASAEFGSVQGAVINIVTRQGSARFQSKTDTFMARKIQNILGTPTLLCIPRDSSDDVIVPRAAPCVTRVHPGGSIVVRQSGRVRA